jgi:hypothetical protein
MLFNSLNDCEIASPCEFKCHGDDGAGDNAQIDGSDGLVVNFRNIVHQVISLINLVE